MRPKPTWSGSPTIRQLLFESGRLGMELLDLLGTPRAASAPTFLPTELVVRSTTRSPRA
jgi:hypothetical protein